MDTSDLPLDSLVELAISSARRSPGRPRKVGAVIWCADGSIVSAFNDFPAGVQDREDRHDDAVRLLWIEHAERNAIFAAAREGKTTAGATLIATFHPCAECARAIVQSGIRRVFTLAPAYADPLWGAGFVISRQLLEEGGVDVQYLPHDPAVMHRRTMGLE